MPQRLAFIQNKTDIYGKGNEISIYVADSVNSEFTVSYAKELKISGASSDVNLNIKIPKSRLEKLDISNIRLTVLDNSLELRETRDEDAELYLRNVTIVGKNTSAPVIIHASELETDGYSLQGNLKIEVASIELFSIPEGLAEDILIELDAVRSEVDESKFKLVGDHSLRFGKHRIDVIKSGSEHGITLSSRFNRKIEIDHVSGNIAISHVGNPRPFDLFETEITTRNGIINFEEQDWAKPSDLYWGHYDDHFIKIEPEGNAEIHIRGSDIPLNIENDAERHHKLDIYADSRICGIQGTLDADDGDINIKNGVGGDVEFSLYKAKQDDGHKINVDEGISIVVESYACKYIFNRNVTLLVRHVNVGSKTVKKDEVLLATKSVISSSINAKKGEFSIGSLYVTKELRLPIEGNVKVEIDASMLSNAAFYDVKKIVDKPFPLVCSSSEFDTSRFEVTAFHEQGMPELTISSGWVDTKDGRFFCLQAALTQLPDWMPEKICYAKAQSECNDDELFVSTAEAFNSSIASILPLTDQVIINTKIDTPFMISQLPTTNAALMIKGTGKVDLTIDNTNEIRTLYLNGIKVLLISSGDIKIPTITFEMVTLDAANKEVAYNFIGNTTMDTTLFHFLTKSQYINLTLVVSEEFETVNFYSDRWDIYLKTKDVLSIKKSVVSGRFGIKTPMNHNIKFSVDSSALESVDGIEFTAATANMGSNSITFTDQWKDVKAYTSPFLFRNLAARTLLVVNIPDGAKIQAAGEGVLGLTPSGEKADIENVVDIDGDFEVDISENKHCHIHGISFKKIAKKIIFKMLQFKKRYYGILKHIYADPEADGEIDACIVKGDIVLGWGSHIKLVSIRYNKNDGRMAMAENNEVSDIDSVTLGYKFSEGGFPQLIIDEDSAPAPKKVKVVYNATDYERDQTDFESWLNYPQPVVVGKNLDCDAWASNVEFSGNLPSGYSMRAACNPVVAGHNYDYSALEVELTKPGKSSGLSAWAIAGIVIGVIAFLVIVGVVIFLVIRKKKDKSSSSSSAAGKV